MNDLSLKPSTIVDAPASKPNGRDKADKASALAALANSFQDLVHRVGSNVDTGLNSIAESRGISAVSESREPSQQFDDSSNDRRDDNGERQVERGSDDTHGNDRNDHARDDHGDDHRPKPEAAPREERADNRQDNDQTPHDDDRTDGAAHAERPGGDDRRGEDHASQGDDAPQSNADSQNKDNNAQNGANAKNNEPGGGEQSASVAQAMVQATAPITGLELAQQVAGANAQGLTDGTTEADAGRANAAAGLAAAAANAKSAGVHAAQTGQQPANAANTALQAAANGQNQNQTETATKGQTDIQKQAQQLARALGDDTRMQINVNVADDADTLTSRPMTTLASGTAVAADSKGQGKAGAQQNTHAATPGQAQVAIANPGQAQNGQAQGQNQQGGAQANQAQALQQMGGDAKGASNTANTAHTATTGASTAGGDGAGSSSNISGGSQAQQTQQTQQTAQAQQHGAARGAQNGPSPAEQVSVRITRALQSGNDRISIRLNPADMGRVEVKMELAHDGRMTAVVTADNRDTLDMLKRDASELQKALQEGGLDLDSNDLTFNHRDDEGQTAEGGDGNAGAPEQIEEEALETAETDPELILSPEDLVLGDGRVDVRA